METAAAKLGREAMVDEGMNLGPDPHGASHVPIGNESEVSNPL
jgi:hypothetical protein